MDKIRRLKVQRIVFICMRNSVYITYSFKSDYESGKIFGTVIGNKICLNWHVICHYLQQLQVMAFGSLMILYAMKICILLNGFLVFICDANY